MICNLKYFARSKSADGHEVMQLDGNKATPSYLSLEKTFATIIKSLSKLKNPLKPPHTNPIPQAPARNSNPSFFSILYTSHINKCQARKVGCKSFSLPDRDPTPGCRVFLRRNVGLSLRPLGTGSFLSTIPSALLMSRLVIFLQQFFLGGGGSR